MQIKRRSKQPATVLFGVFLFLSPPRWWEYTGMSTEKKTTATEAANWLGALAALICGAFGYDQGEWPGALAAAAVAFGGVHLAFAAVALAFRLAAVAVVLLLMLVALKNRWDWLTSLIQ